ncbi:McrC family protein [Rhizobium sp. P28RR-XV]|uniref:McrC family protein n=1 Tax=Rhizobium sp. P28RR-XV TaxID=2726737 RepID=UPI0014573B02|nr:McrC family protein [Rhizobium sp. P28RR-XV]NLR88265.1 McrC family protein [Rhizobium sp. P28RR-XV]
MASPILGRTLTIHEFDILVGEGAAGTGGNAAAVVPNYVFEWLQEQCLAQTEGEGARWARLAQRGGRLVVQVTNYVGVIRAPGGLQIEVLPKVGRAGGADENWARRLLIRMLSCLGPFRHIRTARAELAATKMSLLEVFVGEFLDAVSAVVKRGLRGSYVTRQGNLPFLRGKLMMSAHLRHNLVRADAFFTEHDDFSTDRPENRLIHAALNEVIAQSVSLENQRWARELRFIFSDVPPTGDVTGDIRKLQPARNMIHYGEALAWAELILTGFSPLTGAGGRSAASLLFPMEMLFEAYVAKHLERAIDPALRLKVHPATHYLVEHQAEQWFRLEPDLVVRRNGRNIVVLDTKWKLLDVTETMRKERYNLSQGDFYQLHAYGHTYLEGEGDVVLVYPKTEAFRHPLEPFFFPNAQNLRLWVMPFCLDTGALICPANQPNRVSFPMILQLVDRQLSRPDGTPSLL